jgi:hypothetical protein
MTVHTEICCRALRHHLPVADGGVRERAARRPSTSRTPYDGDERIFVVVLRQVEAAPGLLQAVDARRLETSPR